MQLPKIVKPDANTIPEAWGICEAIQWHLAEILSKIYNDIGEHYKITNVLNTAWQYCNTEEEKMYMMHMVTTYEAKRKAEYDFLEHMKNNAIRIPIGVDPQLN